MGGDNTWTVVALEQRQQRQLSSKRGLGFLRLAAEGKEQVKKRRRERNHFITMITRPKRPVNPMDHFNLSRIKCGIWLKQQTARLFTTAQCNGQISDLSIRTRPLPISFSSYYSERTRYSQDTQKRLQNAAKEPRFSRNNLNDTQKHSNKQKRRQQLRNKILSITNIFKGCKITDLTRPNELGTTTNKVAMRSLERTRL
jgi:hypothetical protein